jgi:hypothetical protein
MGLFSGPRVTGDYDAHVVILQTDQATAASMLPPELALMPQSVTPPGKHPVMVSFMIQRNVRMEWGWLHGPKFNYLEFAVGVPFTRLTHPRGTFRGPFFFAPLLFLNNWIAIFMGLFWGFAKHDAWMKEAASCFTIGQASQTFIEAAFQPSGDWGKLFDFPYANGIPALLGQTGIGKTVLGPLMTIPLEQDTPDATVQPVTANVQILQAFLKGLPAGNYQLQALNQVPLGAYRMRAHWWLGMPQPPSTVKASKP